MDSKFWFQCYQLIGSVKFRVRYPGYTEKTMEGIIDLSIHVQEYLEMDLHVARESKGSSPLLEFLSASLEALWSSLLGSSWGFQLCKNICAFVSRKPNRVQPNFLGICERCQFENIPLKTRMDAKQCFFLAWKVGFIQPKILSGKSYKGF
jgi:hypothetical protein